MNGASPTGFRPYTGGLRARVTFVFGLMFFAAALAVLAGTMILVQNSMEYSLDIAYSKPTVTGRYYPDDSETKPQDRAALASSKAGDEATKRVILRSMRRNLLFKGGLTVLGVGIVATTLGWLVCGRLLRPLSQITATARLIAGRTLHRRISLDAPAGEVKSLADSFDSMLDRLDDAFAGQSRFISNAAHELKTPLALNRTLVEVAMARKDCSPQVSQLGENLLAVNDRHERLIDALLTLARAERPVTERVPVDLADLARSVLTTLDDTAKDRNIQVVTSLEPAPTVGDPILLEQVIRNLVDNALAYNLEGGWVRVGTRRGPNGSELDVTNTGSVITPQQVPALFEPFRRLTNRVGSARGNGLGLSIVRAVAQSHGGDASALPRPDGGLVVRVSLPPGWLRR